MGVDRAFRVVEIERRNRVTQREVGLEIRLDGPDVLPVAAIDVRLHALAGHGVGDDVAPEIDELRVGDRLLEDLALEEVDAHRREVAGSAPRQLGRQPGQPLARRLLVEVHDAPAGVHLEDAERRRLILGDRDDRHGGVGAAGAVGLQHRRVVHAVQLIAREDQDVARRRAPHVTEALADGVGGALEPVAALFGLLGGQHADERRREHVELVGHRDVFVQALRVELRQHEDLAQAGVQAVADRDVDQSVFAPDRHRRLRTLEGEREQARAAPAPENDRQHVVHRHRGGSISETLGAGLGRLVFAEGTYSAAAPSDRGEPGSWRCDGTGPCWRIGTLCPPVEPRRRRASVQALRIPAVLLPVLEDIDQARPDLAWRAQGACVIAARPDGSSTRKYTIDPARQTDLERRNAESQRIRGIGFDDQVKVIVLNGEVQEAKPRIRR